MKIHKLLASVMLICSVSALANTDACYGDPISGEGFAAFQESIGEIKKNPKLGMEMLVSESKRGSLFASIYIDAMYYERGRKLKKFHSISLMNKYAKSECLGYRHMVAKSMSRSLIYGRPLRAGDAVSPDRADWTESRESSTNEAAKWMNLFLYGKAGGTDAWVEAYETMRWLSECKGVAGADRDTNELWDLMPDYWKSVVQRSWPAEGASCSENPQ